MTPADEARAGIELRWVEFAESLRATETVVLHMLGLLRGVDPAIPATVEFALSTADAVEVLALRAELGDLADQLQFAADSLPAEDIHFRWRDIQQQASAAVAAGVGDPRRLLVLARCLGVPAGFRALAESLRCTESHLSWDRLHVGDVIGAFRDADRSLARSLTNAANLSPDSSFPALSRQQVTRLASVLETYVTKSPFHSIDQRHDDGQR